jgi:translation initiation factor 5
MEVILDTKDKVNIPSYIQDPGHRYKMPKIQIKIEGKGNGIRTNFPNMEKVAEALRVPPNYILKWFAID